MAISPGRLGRVGAAGLLCATAVTIAHAAPPGAVVAPRSPEIMLYFNRPIGAGGALGGGLLKPTFGVRLAQVRQLPNSGDPEAGAAMQHRDLLNWQFERGSDVRLQLGHRVTWDFTHGSFGASRKPAMSIGPSSLRGVVANGGAQAWAASAAAARPPLRGLESEHSRDIAGVARDLTTLTTVAFGPMQRMLNNTRELSAHSHPTATDHSGYELVH